MGKPRTVRDFKAFVEREAGGQFPVPNRFSDEQVGFWEELNRLGGRNFGTQRPEDVPDIDATVELSDGEWDDLTARFRRIMAM